MFKRVIQLEYNALRPQDVFPHIAMHIRSQVEKHRHVPDLERLKTMPSEVQTLFWLWRFDCEAESGGFTTFLIGHLGFEAPQVYTCLKQVGATELVDRLEAAIPLAIEAHAEFVRGTNLNWYKQFQRKSEFPTLKSVDKGTYPRLYKDLREKILEFIKSHEAVFVQ